MGIAPHDATFNPIATLGRDCNVGLAQAMTERKNAHVSIFVSEFQKLCALVVAGMD